MYLSAVIRDIVKTDTFNISFDFESSDYFMEVYLTLYSASGTYSFSYTGHESNSYSYLYINKRTTGSPVTISSQDILTYTPGQSYTCTASKTGNNLSLTIKNNVTSATKTVTAVDDSFNSFNKVQISGGYRSDTKTVPNFYDNFSITQ